MSNNHEDKYVKKRLKNLEKDLSKPEVLCTVRAFDNTLIGAFKSGFGFVQFKAESFSMALVKTKKPLPRSIWKEIGDFVAKKVEELE